jgi:hypothetical protein
LTEGVLARGDDPAAVNGQRHERQWAAIAALGVAMTASVAYLLSIDSHLSFVADDWELLARRPGWSPGVFLDPFYEHLIAGPILIYKALLGLFGISSAMPYFVVSTALFALTVALVFAYLRSRVGDWLALIVVLPLLFLGAGAGDLFWAFQMGFFGSLAAGVGMLIALDRDDRRGDKIACLLLFVSFLFASLGVAFAGAALVKVLLGPRPRRRLVYVLAPVGAYALWWLGWGHTAQSHISLENFEHLPEFILDAAGAGVASLLGGDPADPSRPSHAPLLGQLLLLVLAIAIGVRSARERKISQGLVVVLVLAFTFWALTGLDREFGRSPVSSRYQFPSAVFLLLILGETLRGLRIPRLAVVAAALVSAVAVYGGISIFHREQGLWEGFGDSWRATLGALEIGGDRVSPDFLVPMDGPPLTYGEYARAAEVYGTPAYGEAELSGALIGAKADETLVAALGISLLRQASGQSLAGAPQCNRYGGAELTSHRLAIEPGKTVTLADAGSRPLQVTLARFGPPPGVVVGGLAPGGTGPLAIPSDDSARPWLVGIEGRGPLRVCFRA